MNLDDEESLRFFPFTELALSDSEGFRVRMISECC